MPINQQGKSEKGDRTAQDLLRQILKELQQTRTVDPDKKKINYRVVLFSILTLLIFSVLVLLFSDPNTFTWVSISLVCLLLAVNIILMNNKFKKSFEPLITFTSTLFLSLVGIYIGLAISDKQTSIEKQKNFIGVLFAAKEELSAIDHKTSVHLSGIKALYGGNDSVFAEQYNKKPIGEIPTLLDNALKQESFLLSIHPEVLYLMVAWNKTSINLYSIIKEKHAPTTTHLSFRCDEALICSRALQGLIDLQLKIMEREIPDSLIKAVKFQLINSRLEASEMLPEQYPTLVKASGVKEPKIGGAKSLEQVIEEMDR
jgi:hypothetical protein